MNIEQQIVRDIEESNTRVHEANKRHTASRLADVFQDLNKDEIYESLVNTKYSNVFSTGTVYWRLDAYGVVWSRTVDSKEEHRVQTLDDKLYLAEYLRSPSKPRKFWF